MPNKLKTNASSDGSFKAVNNANSGYVVITLGDYAVATKKELTLNSSNKIKFNSPFDGTALQNYFSKSGSSKITTTVNATVNAGKGGTVKGEQVIYSSKLALGALATSKPGEYLDKVGQIFMENVGTGGAGAGGIGILIASFLGSLLSQYEYLIVGLEASSVKTDSKYFTNNNSFISSDIKLKKGTEWGCNHGLGLTTDEEYEFDDSESKTQLDVLRDSWSTLFSDKHGSFMKVNGEWITKLDLDVTYNVKPDMSAVFEDMKYQWKN